MCERERERERETETERQTDRVKEGGRERKRDREREREILACFNLSGLHCSFVKHEYHDMKCLVAWRKYWYL
jgi:hypothetical protein